MPTGRVPSGARLGQMDPILTSAKRMWGVPKNPRFILPDAGSFRQAPCGKARDRRSSSAGTSAGSGRGERGEGPRAGSRAGRAATAARVATGEPQPAAAEQLCKAERGFASPMGKKSLQTRNNRRDQGSPVEKLEFTLKNLPRNVCKMCSCSLSRTLAAFAPCCHWYL